MLLLLITVLAVLRLLSCTGSKHSVVNDHHYRVIMQSSHYLCCTLCRSKVLILLIIMFLNKLFFLMIQTVVADGFKSSPETVVKVVPQGSISGSLVFSLYVPVYNIYSPTEHCHVYFYADDVILYATGSTANHLFPNYSLLLLTSRPFLLI